MQLKNLKYASLYDCYGKLLSEKQKFAVEMYYGDDFSLSEIAEHLGITRQGVRDQIKHAEDELDTLESTLMLYKKTCELRNIIEEIKENYTSDNKLASLCEKALDILDN